MKAHMPGKSREAKLLLQTRQLREQVTAFRRSARRFAGSLGKAVDDKEVEEMVTPRANILGTLECLVADDLENVLKKLVELDGLLGSGERS